MILHVLLLFLLYAPYCNADDTPKQCVPCNLPQAMCEVCEDERLYLLAFHNVAEGVSSADFDLQLIFSDAPDFPYEAGKGLPEAGLICAPADIEFSLLLTYYGFGDPTSPVKIDPQGCDIITIMNQDGSDDLIIKQNSTSLAPQEGSKDLAAKVSAKKPIIKKPFTKARFKLLPQSQQDNFIKSQKLRPEDLQKIKDAVKTTPGKVLGTLKSAPKNTEVKSNGK